MSITVRPATVDDAETIYRFIVELATYEKEPDAVEVDIPTLRAQLAASPPPFEAFIAEEDEPLGFALGFPTYSTWRGAQGFWLEDFYVTPAARGRGAGDALFACLLELCEARGYGRLELTALNWNELAQRFYRKRGGEAMTEWTRWRFAFKRTRAR